MKSVRRLPAALLVIPLLYCAPTRLLACACCTDEGQYLVEENARTSELQIAEMSLMKLGPTAELYVGPGDKEDAKGILNPSYEYGFDAVMNDKGTEWKFTFRDETGATGTLWLPVKNAAMSSYKIDIHDERKSAGGGPLIYKEWRFRGRVRGDGIFKSGLSAPARYRLIFQGRGNNCDAGFDFTHWRLDVTGSKADFAFTGKLVTDEAEHPAVDPEATPDPAN